MVAMKVSNCSSVDIFLPGDRRAEHALLLLDCPSLEDQAELVERVDGQLAHVVLQVAKLASVDPTNFAQVISCFDFAGNILRVDVDDNAMLNWRVQYFAHEE